MAQSRISPSGPRGGHSGVFYGWWIVAALFVVMTTISGLAFYNQAVLLEALVRERGFPVRLVSLATTIFFASAGLTGLFVAWCIDRFDARYTISAGAVTAAAALLWIGRVETLGELYATFALFGVGFAGANMVPSTTLITRWFIRRRPMALAVASTGLSLGGIVVTPLAARLIAARGLEAATPWLGLMLILGVAPVAWWRLRDRPQVLGLEPDGGESALDRAEVARRAFWVEAPFRTRFFYLMSATFLFGLCAQVGSISHHFNLVREATSAGTAELAVSVLAASSIVGRFLCGWLVGRVPLRVLAIVILILQSVALVLLGMAIGPLALLGFSCVFGLTVGSFLLLQSLLVAEAFGILRYARVFSVSALVGAVGLSSGPALLGFVHDLSHGYPMAFGVAGACSLVGASCLAAAGRMPSEAASDGASRPSVGVG